MIKAKDYVTLKHFIHMQTGMIVGRYYDIFNEYDHAEYISVVIRIEELDGQPVIRLYEKKDGKETALEHPERILEYLSSWPGGLYHASECRG